MEASLIIQREEGETVSPKGKENSEEKTKSLWKGLGQGFCSGRMSVNLFCEFHPILPCKPHGTNQVINWEKGGREGEVLQLEMRWFHKGIEKIERSVLETVHGSEIEEAALKGPALHLGFPEKGAVDLSHQGPDSCIFDDPARQSLRKTYA